MNFAAGYLLGSAYGQAIGSSYSSGSSYCSGSSYRTRTIEVEKKEIPIRRFYSKESIELLRKMYREE